MRRLLWILPLCFVFLSGCPAEPPAVECGGTCKPTQFCQNGQCVCRIGFKACGGDCSNLQNDPKNCGACGQACGSGATCQRGVCLCPSGAALCGGACVDLRSDTKHCGACNRVCGATDVCSDGECFSTCQAPASTDCSRSCVDLQTNALHCGSCGQICKAREICTGGSCKCPPGFAGCNGDCVDLRVDSQNCGSCGEVCQDGKVCAQGQCVATCPKATPTVCFGGCFSTDGSLEHCGGCGKACGPLERCIQGKCSCGEGLASCNGRCVDLQTSRSYCGSCDTSCPEGQVCGAGQCLASCPAPTPTVCFGGCIDTKGDPRHCGGCGKACPQGQICKNGQCGCEREIPGDEIDNDCDGKIDEEPFGRVETYAGGSNSSGITLREPAGVAVDSQGDVYVADTQNHRIQKFVGGGFQVIAGTGAKGYKDGPGSQAEFFGPHGLYVAPSGEVYVADTQNHRIRKIDLRGNVTTIAGSGNAGYKDGDARSSEFKSPLDVAGDGQGSLYIADAGNFRLRKLNLTSMQITSVAGNGAPGFRDGKGPQAAFADLHRLAVDPAGTIYVADSTNHVIRSVSPDGEVTTIGSGSQGWKDGPEGNAQFSLPSGLAVDAQGKLYIADDGNLRVRLRSPGGQVTTIVGSGRSGQDDGSAFQASFGKIHQIALSPQGVLYVADLGNHTIRRVDKGQVTTLAAETIGFREGPRLEARFSGPGGLAFLPTGEMIVADTQNHRIRKIDKTEVVSTIAGSGTPGFKDSATSDAQFNFPSAVAVGPRGDIYVADTENHRIRKIDPQGQVTTIAGEGTPGWFDGSGKQAKFTSPRGLLALPSGDIYVADSGNHCIRKIDPQGNVTTIAGSPASGFGDGIASQALFSEPTGLAFDTQGNLYIADTGNHAIRKFSTQGQVTTLAGNGSPGIRDGASGLFNAPTHLILGLGSLLYVVDSQNHRVRMVTLQGQVSTLVGQKPGLLDGDIKQALLNVPFGIASDKSGSLLISDRGNACIRRLYE